MHLESTLFSNWWSIDAISNEKRVYSHCSAKIRRINVVKLRITRFSFEKKIGCNVGHDEQM
jgi:hypothetical protein